MITTASAARPISAASTPESGATVPGLGVGAASMHRACTVVDGVTTPISGRALRKPQNGRQLGHSPASWAGLMLPPLQMIATFRPANRWVSVSTAARATVLACSSASCEPERKVRPAGNRQRRVCC